MVILVMHYSVCMKIKKFWMINVPLKSNVEASFIIKFHCQREPFLLAKGNLFRLGLVGGFGLDCSGWHHCSWWKKPCACRPPWSLPIGLGAGGLGEEMVGCPHGALCPHQHHSMGVVGRDLLRQCRGLHNSCRLLCFLFFNWQNMIAKAVSMIMAVAEVDMREWFLML